MSPRALILTLLLTLACGRIVTRVPDVSEDVTDTIGQQDTASGDMAGPGACAPPCGADERCLGGSCHPLMVLIDGGETRVGCDGGDCPTDSSPPITVVIAPFSIDAAEVTVAAYRACVQDGGAGVDAGCTIPGTKPGCSWAQPGRDEHPINCVSWQEASEYCAWAGKRLCTEAEWELTARGICADETACAPYPWGDEDATCARAVMAEVDSGCGLGTTDEVGARVDGATAEGAYDLAGNVWEWTADCFGPLSKLPVDGSSAEHCLEHVGERTRRGGGFSSSAASLRSYVRLGSRPNESNADLGFRCCADGH